MERLARRRQRRRRSSSGLYTSSMLFNSVCIDNLLGMFVRSCMILPFRELGCSKSLDPVQEREKNDTLSNALPPSKHAVIMITRAWKEYRASIKIWRAYKTTAIVARQFHFSVKAYRHSRFTGTDRSLELDVQARSSFRR